MWKKIVLIGPIKLLKILLRNKATVKSFTYLFWFYDRVVVSTGNPNKEAKWIMYVTVMKEGKLSAIVQYR